MVACQANYEHIVLCVSLIVYMFPSVLLSSCLEENVWILEQAYPGHSGRAKKPQDQTGD